MLLRSHPAVAVPVLLLQGPKAPQPCQAATAAAVRAVAGRGGGEGAAASLAVVAVIVGGPLLGTCDVAAGCPASWCHPSSPLDAAVVEWPWRQWCRYC